MSEEENVDVPEIEEVPEEVEAVDAPDTEEAPEEEETADAPKTEGKKPKVKRWPIVVGVIVVVLIVAVIGGLKWHEQPSFCSICHTPMNGYLETYEANLGQAATDKYGNKVEDASGMMAAVHRADTADSDDPITCLSCHEPTMSEQLSEGLHWLTGSYEVDQTYNETFVPTERNLKQLTEARGDTATQFCLNEACHTNDDGSVMTIKDLAKLTSGDKFSSRNPHSHFKHAGNISCGDCHKAHRASTVYCTKCHEDTYVPDGWVTYDEATAAEPVSLKSTKK